MRDIRTATVNTRIPCGNWGVLKRVAYALVLLFLALFLYRMGAEPWYEVARNARVALVLIIVAGVGMVVQAQSYRKVVPPDCAVLGLAPMVYIWAISAAVSVIAPLVAGIATRTALLARAGMPISASLQASMRQVWIGVEMALLLGGLALATTGLPYSTQGSVVVLLGWLLMLLTRRFSAWLVRQHRGDSTPPGNLLASLSARLGASVYPWFAMQVFLMSVTYLIGFNGLGAALDLQEAIVLSSLTVLMSVLVFVPNGLGFTDAVWVLVATQSGLTTEKAVALAIIFRTSHLLAALALAGSMGIVFNRTKRYTGQGAGIPYAPSNNRE